MVEQDVREEIANALYTLGRQKCLLYIYQKGGSASMSGIEYYVGEWEIADSVSRAPFYAQADRMLARMKEAGRREGLRQAAEVANTWGERSTTPGEKTIWHAIGESIGGEITALMGDEGARQHQAPPMA